MLGIRHEEEGGQRGASYIGTIESYVGTRGAWWAGGRDLRRCSL